MDLNLLAHFSVLRAGKIGKVNSSLLGRKRPYGIDLRYARNISVDGATVSVVPGRSGICMVSWLMYGVSCAPSPVAVNSGVVGTVLCGTLPAGKVAVYALVPDGVHKVAVKYFGPDGEAFFGPTTDERVVDNLMYAVFDAKRDPPEGVVVGRQQLALADSPRSFDVACS